MPSVNPKILVWTREEAALTMDEAVKKLNIKDSLTKTAVEKLIEYEEGKKSPSRSLLVRMAKQYRQPLLTFYLQAPPQKSDRGEDFRTVSDSYSPISEAIVDSLVKDIQAKQRIIKESLIDEDEAPELDFIGNFSLNDPQVKIIDQIYELLAFDLSKFRNAQKIDGAFKYLRMCCEEAGIFVLLAGNLGTHHTNIDVETFRGFALADEVAPFIVINDRDARSAWAFTLIHELVHLLLGKTGVSGGKVGERKIEKFCDEIASEILLPENDLASISLSGNDFHSLKDQISKLAYEKRISSSQLTYRLPKIGYIDRKQWQELKSYFYNQWLKNKQRTKEKLRLQDGGPNVYVLRRQKLGNALVELAGQYLRSGALSNTKASILLGVKPLTV